MANKGSIHGSQVRMLNKIRRNLPSKSERKMYNQIQPEVNFQQKVDHTDQPATLYFTGMQFTISTDSQCLFTAR